MNHKCVGASQDDVWEGAFLLEPVKDRCVAQVYNLNGAPSNPDRQTREMKGVCGRHRADLSATRDGIWHLIRRKGQGQRQTGVGWSEESLRTKFHKGGKGERGSETRRSKGIKTFDQCGFLKVSFSTDWRYKHLKLDLSFRGTLKLHLKSKIKMKNNRM